MSAKEAKQTLDIPAKPAAITATNVAVLTGIGVAATGPVGAAVTAAVAVVTTAAVKGKKRAAAKAAMRAASPTGGRRSAGASSRGSSTKGASAGRTQGGLLSRLTGGRRSGGTGTAAKGAANRSPGASKAAAGKTTSGRTTPLSRIASAFTPKSRKNGAGASRPASTSPTGASRKASAPRRAATKAFNATWPKMKKAVKGAVTAGSSKKTTERQPGTASQSGKWKKARKFFQENLLGRKKKEAGKKPEENVENKVAMRSRPINSLTTPTKGRVIVTRRVGSPVPLGTPSTARATGGKTMSGSMKHNAAQMWVYAGSFEPRGAGGFLQIVDEMADLPDITAYVAGSIGALLAKSQRKWPMDEAVKAKLADLVETLHSAAAIAKSIPGLVEDVHADDLKRFRKPRTGEHLMNVAS